MQRDDKKKATNWVPSSILDSCVSLKSVMHSDENVCPQTVPFPRLANSFLRAKLKENRKLWGAHNAEDIYPYIFLKSKYGAIALIILSQVYYATHWIFWKWGILLIFCPVLPGAYSVMWCVYTNRVSENMFMDYREDYFHRSFVSGLSLRLKFLICGKIKYIFTIDRSTNYSEEE